MEHVFFLVQDFVYSNEWLVEEWLFFTFFKLKNQLFAYEEKIGLSEQELLNTMKLPMFVFVGNPINKNRVVIV